MSAPTQRRPRILLTGATGFIGHNILASLLRDGFNLALLSRHAPHVVLATLATLVLELGVDVHAAQRAGQLKLLKADLAQPIHITVDEPIDMVIHSAASTRFEPSSDGEPYRSNVMGTGHLLDWASRHNVSQFVQVSSAYSCGVQDVVVHEVLPPRPDKFHNTYEATKWEAESLCKVWEQAAPDRCVTLLRPSIVVGEFETGRATRFAGPYLTFRAADVLSRSLENKPREERYRVPLRIKGFGHEPQNLVPVDYVADAVAAVVKHPQLRGGIYHLTNPVPPTNDQLKRAIESHFDIAGGSFIDPNQFNEALLTDQERQFYSVSKAVEHYVVDSPRFARGNASFLDVIAGLKCPTYDQAALIRLIESAQKCQWGRAYKQINTPPPKPADTNSDLSICADYFETFLPQYVPLSHVARMKNVSATVRFIITDAPGGQWVCRFGDGQVKFVHRGDNHFQEDFAYHTSLDVFREAVAGRTTPQATFLSGKAEITGNVEQALRMAMILHAFTQQFPFEPAKPVAAGVSHA